MMLILTNSKRQHYPKSLKTLCVLPLLVGSGDTPIHHWPAWLLGSWLAWLGFDLLVELATGLKDSSAQAGKAGFPVSGPGPRPFLILQWAHRPDVASPGGLFQRPLVGPLRANINTAMPQLAHPAM